MPLPTLTPLEWAQLLPFSATALVVGLLCFALSWIRPQPWLSFAGAGERTALLRLSGALGAGFVLIVALLAQIALLAMQTLWFDAGTWYRPLPLVTTLLAIAAIGLATSRAPRPGADAPTIAPRRPWHAFAPKPALWAGAGAGALLIAATVWQGLLPRHTEQLPELGGNQGVFHLGGSAISPPWAFGWAGNAPTLVAVAALFAVWIWALAADVGRPVEPAAAAGPARTATARLVCGVALAGLTLGLGTVWSQVWAPPTWAVFMEEPGVGRGTFIGSDYRGLVDVVTVLGRALQGVGIALLARIAIDSWRAGRRPRAARGETARASEASLGGGAS